jgi:hypothetical protein
MHKGKWNDIFADENERLPSTVGGINDLPMEVKREIYSRLIPAPIFALFQLPEDLIDPAGRDLMHLKCAPGTSTAEMSLFHQFGFQDPVVYGQITDTIYGQIHILLYVINDPYSPRFDIDRLPDGQPTDFGISRRNIPEEIAALQAGLAPGQIRSGLRMLREANRAFEEFSLWLGHDRFFAEPLYYHNAVIFERAGFAYLKGRRLMENIDAGFAPSGELTGRLDGSTAFRMPGAEKSIRLRSWALHDGIMDSFFTDVTMYKVIGKHAGIQTTLDIDW